MASDNLHGLISRAAAADLSALQYRFMSLTADQIATVSGAGILADGVLQNDPISGAAGSLCPLNGSVSKIEAGAAVAANADVMTDANGRAITATATNEICGKALQAASAAGEIIEVLIGYRGTA